MQLNWHKIIQTAAEGSADKADWQIMDAIMFKGCGSLYAVEKATGIHRQKVKRRLEKLGLSIDCP